MGASKRHHVVSRGYQRFFADGEQIMVCDKVPRANVPRVRLVGIADVFMEKHFNSYWANGVRVNTLEDEWGRLEREALPAVGALIDGRERPTSRDEVRVLASIHFARSFALRDVMAKAQSEVLADASDWRHHPEIQTRWLAERDDELTEEVFEAILARGAKGFGPGSAYAIERMGHFYNACLDHLRGTSVQAFVPVGRGVDFILPDTPVVLIDEQEMRIGLGSGLALKEARTIYMPLAPRLAVMFAHEPQIDGQAELWYVQHLNSLAWRGAKSQVAFHNDTATFGRDRHGQPYAAPADVRARLHVRPPARPDDRAAGPRPRTRSLRQPVPP